MDSALGTAGQQQQQQQQHETDHHLSSSHSSRIPEALQAVFLESNRGREVIDVPEGNVANKTFYRKWPFFMDRRKKAKTKTKIQFSRTWLMRKCHINNNNNNTRDKQRSYQKEQHDETSSDRTGMTSDSSSEGTPKKFVETTIEEKVVEKTKKTVEEVIETKDDNNKTQVSTRKKFGQSPRQYLDDLLYSRGYPTHVTKTLSTGYYNRPTPLQNASFNSYLIHLVNEGETEQLMKMVESGISLNPCNAYGESLLHTICRRGQPEVLKVFLEAGASVQVSDDCGRTVLHDACWRAEPSFEMIEMIISKDKQLLHLSDIHGGTPLSYVRKQDWGKWICFLESRKDFFWPASTTFNHSWWPRMDSVDSTAFTSTLNDCKLLHQAPLTCQLADPKNALTIELATMVTSGRLSPEEAVFLCREDDEKAGKKRMMTNFKHHGKATDENGDDLYFDENESEHSYCTSDTDDSSNLDNSSDDHDSCTITDLSDSSSDDDYSAFEQEIVEMMGSFHLKSSTLPQI